jgi:hypothetical protein
MSRSGTEFQAHRKILFDTARGALIGRNALPAALREGIRAVCESLQDFVAGRSPIRYRVGG